MTTQTKSPVRIILKNVSSDVHGVAVESNYITVDIDSEEIEKLLYAGDGRLIRRQYKVVGAELLDVEGADEKHCKRHKLSDNDEGIPF